MSDPAPFALADLVLARLLTARPDTGLTVGAVLDGIAPYLPAGLDARERRAALAAAIDTLRRSTAVEQRGDNRLALTESGRGAIVARLQLAPPGGKPVRWQTVLPYLLAGALALPAPNAAQRQRLAGAAGLRASLLRRRYALPIPPYPTLSQARDALCWHCLAQAAEQPALVSGCDGLLGQRFSVTALAARLLSNLLGTAPGPALAADVALRRLAADAVGASRVDADALRAAAIGRALALTTSTTEDTSTVDDSRPAEFAARVQAVAQSCRHGRFGRNKLLVSALYTAYHRRHPGADLQTFKQRLLQAHRQRLLSLLRADLQEAMDPAELAASEIDYLGARFHFLQIG